jgi:hypothetical protein
MSRPDPGCAAPPQCFRSGKAGSGDEPDTRSLPSGCRSASGITNSPEKFAEGWPKGAIANVCSSLGAPSEVCGRMSS